ncbi:thiamine pyrophosphate-binding protein [Microbacterium sp. A1-JK]|uniref:thiamine pyrophosphate-binding protein n=1 Tax=Microbacterium sp. A1-JK TaxID=3177516 RepID=UPI00388B9505
MSGIDTLETTAATAEGEGEPMTVAEAVGRALAERGVAHVFGVVGSGNFMVTHGLVSSGVPFTAARHEMGAACMADSYSRLTDRVAAVSLHQGCGLTNAMTGIGEATKSNTPLLVVTGDTAVGQEQGNFVIDQDSLVAAVGAVPRRIHSSATAVADAVAAYDIAVRDRTTVVLSLPVDLQAEIWQEQPAPAPVPRVIPAGASAEALEELARILTAAQRPVILGGRGARQAAAELRALGEQTGAILVPSAGARGLFTGEEWALDVMGGFATPGARELIQEADVLVAFGAALNQWTAHHGTLTAQPTLVQVDDRREAFGKHRGVSLGIVGDTASVASAVTGMLAAQEAPRIGLRTPETRARIRRIRHWVDDLPAERHSPGHIGAGALTAALDAMLPIERVVVPDGGNVNMYPGAFLRVPDERGFVMPLSFQSIGLGLSNGIGAAIARPDRMAVVGTGDGSFLMAAVELDTAVKAGLGMIVVVYNDEAYGAEVHLFADHPEKQAIVRFPETDIASIARGYGCAGVTVRSLDDLAGVQAWLDGPRDRPLVVDAKITGDASPLMRENLAH